MVPHTGPSRRGTVAELPVTRPIVRQLPAIYQDHLFVEQFTSGLDTVIAPAHHVLDCLHAYVDPGVAPDDFVRWLAEWIGLRLDEDWSPARSRRLVAHAVEMFATRGTAVGLREEVALYTDGVGHVDDPGGTYTSAVPGASYDSAEYPDDRTVRVVVDVPDAATVNWNGLQQLIRHAVPAHLPVEVELREVELRQVELRQAELRQVELREVAAARFGPPAIAPAGDSPALDPLVDSPSIDPSTVAPPTASVPPEDPS